MVEQAQYDGWRGSSEGTDRTLAISRAKSRCWGGSPEPWDLRHRLCELNQVT